MQEERIFFSSGDLRLEGLYSNNPGNNGVVITHPHPQMGGNMFNNVVDTLVQAFNNRYYSTLRFNFRGVGRSEGYYDNRRGEGKDVVAAWDYLAAKEKTNILMAGYSFGAVVIMDVFARLDAFADFVLVSPLFNTEYLKVSNKNKKRGLIICGEEDQFCKVAGLQKWTEENDFHFITIKGADHFYQGMEGSIIMHIDNYLKKGE
jgi:alpha/beta superfamily hydrolase